MAQLEKLKRSFSSCRKDYAWKDFLAMIEKMGFTQLQAGKTGGSKRKYILDDRILYCDEPHDGIMGPGMVRRLRSDLEDMGHL